MESNNETTITEKLSEIQTALKAPKSQYNKFGKYNYRTCEDILEAVKPLLKSLGCALTLTDNLEQIGDRYYIKSTAKFLFSKDSISVSAYAREDDSRKGMDVSQLTGATSSYARKYALNGLFCTDDNKDADSKPPATAANPMQLKRIKSLINETQSDELKLVTHFSVKGLAALNEDQAKQAISMLENKLNKQLDKAASEERK